IDPWVVVLLYFILFRTHSNVKNFPPGPWPLPVFGNLLELNLDSPTSDLQRLAKRYGSIYSLKIGSKPAVVLNGLQAIKEALVNKSEDFSGRPQDLLINHAVNVKGIVLSWREQRRFGLMTLRNFGLGKQSMENRILQEIDRIVRVLEQSTGMFKLNTVTIL
uniref:Uncharacterized protein n=1 Tax=Periophthalmus magnuspinnatus TaxID=409849 RepID=A0A3B4ALK7_9GOBI